MPILLGFEIPTGQRIEVPSRGHLAWFGQTQLSGKTTAIEALVYRGEFKSIAFITKRGEGSFLTGRMIPPYFSEPADDPEQPMWRWVCSILEASQKRRMNFEESWIIRACEEPKHAESLMQVHQNIIDLLRGEKRRDIVGKGNRAKTKEVVVRRPVTGINQGVYTSLKAYFDIVIPQLARLPYVKKLELYPGLNVMDLRSYAVETQGLVISSTILEICRHHSNVRVIVPEAQDFVPQGKGSPVKMACEMITRKGAADGNFMWLDSQDMAAVDKQILRAVSILGVGVQGEAHEMERSIAHLFGSVTKLTPRDIGSLKIGEFYVRVAGGSVSKVYVMPAWMSSEVHARAIAMGEESVESARQILKKFKKEMVANEEAPESAGRTKVDAESDPRDQSSGPNDASGDHDRTGDGSPVTSHQSPVTDAEADPMYKEKYEDLIARLRPELEACGLGHLLTESPASSPDVKMAELAHTGAHGAGEATKMASSASDDRATLVAGKTLGEIYDYVTDRARRDNGILQLLSTRPELRVTIQRPTIELDDSKLGGKIARLIADGFFDKPKDRAAVAAELIRRGGLKPKTNLKILSPFLAQLTEQGYLTAESEGYLAVPGIKVYIVEK